MSQGPQQPTASDSVDLEVLREATAGERDLMQELAQLYLNDTDLQLRALQDALQNKEIDRIRRIGHALRGSSASVGAGPAAEIFGRLEEAARANDMARIRASIQQGQEEFRRIRRALVDLR